MTSEENDPPQDPARPRARPVQQAAKARRPLAGADAPDAPPAPQDGADKAVPGPRRRKALAAAADAVRPARPDPAATAQARLERRRAKRAALEDEDDESIPLQAVSGTGEFAAGPIDTLTPSEERLLSRTTRLTFVLGVLGPIVVSALYLFLIATDRYAVEVKFAVRSPSGVSSNDILSAVTGGAAGGASQSDSYMVVEYLQSRQFLDELTTRLDLDAIYAIDRADPLMRLAANAAKEDQVDYLQKVITPTFDSTSQIITVEAQAFTPEDARRVAADVLETASAMVNRLSEQARQDTLRLAQAEVDRAEAALKAQRGAIAAFRETQQKIDPQQSVTAQENVLAGLQSDLARTQAELRSLRSFLSADAPSVRVLKSRIDSIRKQIAAERASLGAGTGEIVLAEDDLPEDDTLNSAVSAYEALAVDLQFHEQAYVSALGSLEAARVEADRQQRYLAAVVLPSLPEAASYPRHFLMLSLIAAVCFLIWGILSMFVHVVREHLR